MNTYPFSPRTHTGRPGRAAALAACLLIVTLLLPGGAGWPAQAAPDAQEPPPSRLPYDGPFSLPRMEDGAAPEPEAGSRLTEPEYVNWSKLVFQSARNQRDWDVYIAQGDGSNQANISNHWDMDIHPRLNRGATRVAFASNRQGNYDIFSMNAGGGGQTRLTDAGTDDVAPAWSPDGSRIAFQAYRDGQAEIYVMNANGSGQTRLTNHGDYDGEPDWSPDGSQIAFVRRAGGQYRIWVMNADGSSQRQLSGQAYSENPAWSPDGSQIAYDSDGNGDGWQEIWLMNADGSNQQQVYDPPEGNTDAWVGGWSPDGRYVAFTRIRFVQYQGQWYWDRAYLDAWDSTQPWNTIRLSSNGADWGPHWASTDALAPTSSVQPLPAQSPATFTVRWSGEDAGGSGLKSYDVQVRDGAGGTWSTWKSGTTDTSASYTGAGSRSYFFRSRARDNAGNVEAWPAGYDAVTTVEALAPETSVYALPAYSRNPVLVTWGGSDPGGSGILSYDVQYRQGNSGAWSDWRMGVTETSAIFNGTAGLEYRFRSRARDRAQNVEAWPATADAITTLYAWAITGSVTDNRGAPVVGMAAATTPAAFRSPPSDGDGAYSAYVATETANYSASWSKAGYSPLPSTAFAPNPDATLDVVLPPSVNVVQNWGFENGNSAWQFGGNLTATVTASERHTGASAAFLGSEARPLRSTTTLPDAPVYPPQGFSAVVDNAGVIHAVWGGSQSKLMVSSKLPTGPWDTAVPIPGTAGFVSTGGDAPVLLVDDQRTMHILWKQIPWNLYYIKKPADTDWSALESVPGVSSSTWRTSMAKGALGAVKVAWCSSVGVQVSERNASGSWTNAQVISVSGQYCGDGLEIVTDPAGLAHVLWWPTSPNAGLFYAAETSSGTWLPPISLLQSSNAISKAEMAVDNHGKVHVAWATGDGVYYQSRPAGGQWSAVERVSVNSAYDLFIAVDDLDTVHLGWFEFRPTDPAAPRPVMYAHRSSDTWSSPVNISQPSAELANWRIDLVVDRSRAVHVLWLDSHAGSADQVIRYATQTAQGQWLSPVEIAAPELWGGLGPKLIVDHSGTPHAFWQAYRNGVYPVSYAGPEPASTAGQAAMSQTVTVPASTLAPTLSFMNRFGTEFPSNSRLEVAVVDGIAATVVYSATTGSNIWAHQWVDLTPWAGRTATLHFRVVEEAGGSRAGAYIDEVTVGSAHPDIWVSQPAWQAAPPGRTFETTLTHGNRGGVAASGGQVTLQLPAELSFVSADPPPAATTPALRWDVGALPAQSGPQTIRVTLQVAASAAGGSTVSTTARITSSTTELEQANNTAQASIYIGSVRYMPVIMR